MDAQASSFWCRFHRAPFFRRPYVPREQALILAANQQRVLGPQAEVRVL